MLLTGCNAFLGLVLASLVIHLLLVKLFSRQTSLAALYRSIASVSIKTEACHTVDTLGKAKNKYKKGNFKSDANLESVGNVSDGAPGPDGGENVVDLHVGQLLDDVHPLEPSK